MGQSSFNFMETFRPHTPLPLYDKDIHKKGSPLFLSFMEYAISKRRGYGGSMPP
jgi:hypothetical protein